jgi:hypothetical protein
MGIDVARQVRTRKTQSAFVPPALLWLVALLGSVPGGELLARSPLQSRRLLLFLVLVAIILAVGVSLHLWLTTSRRLALLFGFGLFASTTIGALVSYRHFERPFVFQSIVATLLVQDVSGSRAHVAQVDELAIQKQGISQFWQRDVGAPGATVQNFQVKYERLVPQRAEYEGLVLVKQEVQERAKGVYDVGTIVSPPLRMGDTVRRILEFDAQAPASEVDGHVLSIRTLTLYAEINLVMPRGRPCREVSIDVQPKSGSKEPPPRVSDGGSRVTWSKQNPETGKDYTVLCRH